jgi:hypothetical protein
METPEHPEVASYRAKARQIRRDAEKVTDELIRQELLKADPESC